MTDTAPENRIVFDENRTDRVGMPEAVLSESKDAESLAVLLSRYGRGSGHPVLFTRLREAAFRAQSPEIQALYDYDPLSCTAFGDRMPGRPENSGSVAIVTAGTSDAFVSHEAARTLEFMGVRHTLIEDCGVAALWRLEKRLDEIRQADVVIVCAGLDAALASVIGGLVPQPVLAVPTSVGYGAAEAGKTALHSMLCSCAQGVSVFNIDNGYGAACAAVRILGIRK